MNAPFLILALAMLAVAVLFIGPPLWRTTVIAQPDPSAIHPASAPPKRWAAICLAAGLMASTVVLYGVVGNRAALAPQLASTPRPVQAQGDIGQAQIEAMVGKLAQRLQTQPDDPQGWRMLAKSYETLGRFDDAVQAYQNLLTHQVPTADTLTDYAVTLGMSKGQTLAGEPDVLIKQALRLEPNHVQALALSGSAAFEQGEYKRAVQQWNKLLATIPKDADMRDTIEHNVERARSLIR